MKKYNVLALIIGISIILYALIGYVKQQNKLESARVMHEKTLKDLQNCLMISDKNYHKMWNKTCTLMDLGDNCPLPKDMYSRIDNLYKQSKDNCLRIFRVKPL